MERVRMWVSAWVVSGCCVGVNMGAVRAVGGGGGAGLRAQTSTHPVCLPAWSRRRSYCTLTMTTTVQSCLSGLGTGRQGHNHRLPSIASFQAAILQHPEAPIARAQDGGDRSTGPWVAFHGHHLAAGKSTISIHQSHAVPLSTLTPPAP